MRAVVCRGGKGWASGFSQLKEWAPIENCGILFCWLVALTAVTFTLIHVLPCCRRPGKKCGSKRPPASPGFLCGHAAGGFLVRLTTVVFILMLFVILVPALQLLPFALRGNREVIEERCQEYVAKITTRQAVSRCTDMHNYHFWYENMTFSGNVTAEVPTPEEAAHPWQEYQVLKSSVSLLVKVLGLLLVMSLCLMPIIGNAAFLMVLQCAGPILLLGFSSAFTQYSIFGPMSGSRMLFWSYDHDAWVAFVKASLIAAMVMLPFYEEIRCVLHIYYCRCLKQNFFYRGKNPYFCDVLKNPYCPFILLTGTSSDFQPPGDEDTISELSFTALHAGSEETGYVPQPTWRTLGKCTALTGAGCLDAISLSMSQALSMRFWLEVLNLSWGDYILFEYTPLRFFDAIAKRAGKRAGYVNRFLHRLPCSLANLLVLACFYMAWDRAHMPDPAETHCKQARNWLLCGLVSLAVLMALGFFSYTPGLSLFALNSVVRQFQQATQFYFVGKVPPRMLYVTDGGVRDCTAITQLLRRRSRRILLVLAAADPRDELGVLKTALEVAREERLASFFDPKDPRRDLQATFELFKEQKDDHYFHLGICYCWDQAGDVNNSEEIGDLYIVKNRLPPEFEEQAVAPLLTEEEITDGPGGFRGRDEECADRDLTASELGPFGCCDCCHTRGMNCGPKFPHGGFTGYLYLTPQWFNSLARLGFSMSAGVVTAIMQTDNGRDLSNFPPLPRYTPLSQQASPGFLACCQAPAGASDSEEEYSRSSDESVG
uniref:Uncharacterized protein n=1 Tax=Alexandrium catenella TaxID=2925 RepID=A0A7S1LR21_ALECA